MSQGLETWRLVVDPATEGILNMATDTWLSRHGPSPVFRVYSWSKPTLSLGRNQKGDWLDRSFLDAEGIARVRRPSGGRALLHLDELTYSVVLPGGSPGSLAQQFCRITGWLGAALRHLGVPVETESTGRSIPSGKDFPGCMEVVGRGELLLGGVKLVGSAQVRTRHGLLQHGVLPMTVDTDLLQRCIPGSQARKGLVDLGFERITAERLATAFLHANGFQGRPRGWSLQEKAAIEELRAEAVVR